MTKRLKGHLKVAPEENPFESLVVELTHRCNMECANCYIPNRAIPDLDTEKLYDILRRLPRRTYIRLIGGEPTLREDLADIIRQVVCLGHKPSLTTNGLKLARLDYCRELKQAGLRHVLVSMNGADDDAAYRVLDGGNFATVKVRALINCFRTGFRVNTGTIVARGVNEQVVARQIETMTSCAEAAGVNFRTTRPWSRVTPVIRLKSVGEIGRHMEGCSYSLNELVHVVLEGIGQSGAVEPCEPVASGLNYIRRESEAATSSVLIPVESRIGPILLRLIDWTVDEDGVPDPGNTHRGRLTEDFRIAPFFEDVKVNEFGY